MSVREGISGIISDIFWRELDEKVKVWIKKGVFFII